MRSNRILFFLLLFINLFQHVDAQKFHVNSYTIESGLPTRMVNDACQDSLGYMWFATGSGIVSYDGFTFLNHAASEGIPFQNYRFIRSDLRNVLWAVPEYLTDTVLYRQHNSWSKITPGKRNLKTVVSSCGVTYLHNNPVLCLGSDAGLDIYVNGDWIHLRLSPDSLKNQVLSIVSSDGKFYCSSRAGVYEVEHKKNTWETRKLNATPGEEVIAMHIDHPGNSGEKLRMLTRNRVLLLQNGSLTLISDKFELPGIDSQTSAYLTADSAGNVFFGNTWAKYFYDGKSGQLFPMMVRNGFASNGCNSVYIDREQNVWFSDSRGIDKVSNLFLLNYYEISGLLEDEVTAILELKEGGMVFGHNNGLTLLHRDEFVRIPFSGLRNNLSKVFDLMQDRDGNVWIAASNSGVGQLLPGRQIKWYPVKQGTCVTSLLQDASGKIWVGATNNMFTLDGGKLTEFAGYDKINTGIRKIFPGTGGEIIAVTPSGLFRIDGTGVDEFPVAGDGSSVSAFAYCQTGSGNVLIGTQHGLFIMTGKRINKFEKSGMIVNAPIYFIVKDHQSRFWLGSNNGVYIWNGDSRLVSFNMKHGLAGRETNRSAAMVDSRGHIWIGTDLGMSCLVNGFFHDKIPAPRVSLQGIEDVEGNVQPMTTASLFSYRNNTLFFHFRGISFVNELLINYRYKLEGFDRNWQTVNQLNLDRIKYHSLKPGTYRLMVQARTDSGEWSETARSEAITIRNPFYREGWFHFLLVLILGIFIFGIVKIIMQRKFSQKLKNEINERKRSEEKTIQTLKALHESEVKYHDLFEFAVDGILVGSKDGVITGANSYMQRLTGMSAAELIGLRIDDLFCEDQNSELPLRYDRLEKHDLVVSRRELHRPDGSRVPVEMHTKMMPDGTYQSILHDITDRKNAEDALKEKARILEQFNNLMIGRELKMIELKKEINELLEKANEPFRYKIPE
jgi:PAS domain S-box-containing protein